MRRTTEADEPMSGHTILLETPLLVALNIAPNRKKRLEDAGFHTVYDLLYTFPLRYEDHRPQDLSLLDEDQATVAVWGVVRGVPTLRYYGGKKSRLAVSIETSEGQELKAVWFNQPYLRQRLLPGTPLLLYGLYDRRMQHITVRETTFSPDQSHKEGLSAVYPTVAGMSPKTLKSLLDRLLDHPGLVVDEVIPQSLRQKYRLLSRKEALYMMHRPQDMNDVAKGRRTLAYEELFLFQLELAMLRARRTKQPGLSHAIKHDALGQVINRLPFTLTSAQERVLAEILSDMEKPEGMYRLLQGDVGSGKTVIAALALYAVVTAGRQGALLVPTEVLAMQHVRSIRKLLPLSVSIGLLTGRTTAGQRKEMMQKLSQGALDLVIGTHALLNDELTFRDLGLVVIDEQHRFGVEQRRMILNKGRQVDVLLMTATPIPRTLTLAFFGDLDVSVLDELPKGRKAVETLWTTPNRFASVLALIEQEIRKGRQAYIIAPLIEESEKVDLQNAIDLTERIIQLKPHWKVGLLHGRLSGNEKERVMHSFVSGEVDVLVTTTVIEVGVDVPNATVMVIIDADRFGLATLHQLRGRVGRSGHQAYCVLVADPKNEVARERLKVMREERDGFTIAQKDLELRGPGDIFGIKQSGLPTFRVSDLTSPRDLKILEVAHKDARSFFSSHLSDPNAFLELPPEERPPALVKFVELKRAQYIVPD